LNKLRGQLQVAAVKAPGFGDNRKSILGDLAILTGSTVFTDELDIKLEKLTADMLGTTGSVTITKEDTILLNGAGEKSLLQERCEQIRSAMSGSYSLFSFTFLVLLTPFLSFSRLHSPSPLFHLLVHSISTSSTSFSPFPTTWPPPTAASLPSSPRIPSPSSSPDPTTSDYDRTKLQERLAKLSGGVAVIRVGGSSEVEVGEKKDRYDDALNATRAAVEEGIVPGGGTALLKASLVLDEVKHDNLFDRKLGINIIRSALTKPARTIAENAGEEGSVVVGTLLEKCVTLSLPSSFCHFLRLRFIAVVSSPLRFHSQYALFHTPSSIRLLVVPTLFLLHSIEMTFILSHRSASRELTFSSSRRYGSDFNTGFNAATGTYEDMIAAGVVDPIKVRVMSPSSPSIVT
jgi:chaperonin GroEL (HSP60 family)